MMSGQSAEDSAAVGTAGERLSAILARAAMALAPAVRLVRPGVGAALASRQDAARALAAWGSRRSPGPLLWLHGASAGELLGAAPTISALRGAGEFALVVTYFSPSGRAALPHLSPDFASFPPLDTRESCERAIAGVRPDLLVFAKLDVWPGLVGAAARAGVPVALVNGIVRDDSARLGRISRTLLRSTYRRIAIAGAATETDARRLAELGLRPEIVEITGDASFDLALVRADAARAPGGARESIEALLPDRPRDGVRLVGGSTWPADEDALLDALDELPAARTGRFALQVVLVPHRPTEAYVRNLEGRVRARGQPVARLGRAADLARLPPHGVVIVDEVGRLAELYTAAEIACVGGGLGGRGLHNVLEPAAAGIPVLFGPRHDRRDARGLAAAGGGFECRPGALSGRLLELLEPSARTRPGRRAREYVESGAGASEATTALLAPLLFSAGP